MRLPQTKRKQCETRPPESTSRSGGGSRSGDYLNIHCVTYEWSEAPRAERSSLSEAKHSPPAVAVRARRARKQKQTPISWNYGTPWHYLISGRNPCLIWMVLKNTSLVKRLTWLKYPQSKSNQYPSHMRSSLSSASGRLVRRCVAGTQSTSLSARLPPRTSLARLGPRANARTRGGTPPSPSCLKS